MKTRVRIAPIERWCEGYKVEQFFPLAGMRIEIVPASMRERDFSQNRGCKGKYWEVSWESRKEIEARLGIKAGPFDILVLCEHMLEIGD